MPTKASVGERWKRVDRAFHLGEGLPPVSLYKVGSFYFILDGHHRVSVASYHGVKWIDAYVTEFDTTGSGVWNDEGTERAPDRDLGSASREFLVHEGVADFMSRSGPGTRISTP